MKRRQGFELGIEGQFRQVLLERIFGESVAVGVERWRWHGYSGWRVSISGQWEVRVER